MKDLTDTSTNNSAAKKLFALALPMAFIQTITIASGFLCMVMLSKLGHQVLAASALIFSSQMSIMVLGMSLLFSLSILVGHAYGAQDYLAIGNFVQQGWTMAVLVSIPIIIFYWHIGSVLVYFGQSPAIANIVQTYFHAYVWGVAPAMLAVCNQQFCYGVHKQKLAIITGFMSMGILLIVAYVLIFGKFGFPALGVAGYGYAMASQLTFYFLFTTFCFAFIEDFKKFNLFHYRVHKGFSYMQRMFTIGWPICAHMGGEVLSFFVSATMVGWLGASALAAYQVVNQYMMLGVVPIFSLSQASGILVGQAVGAKRYDEIKQLGYKSLLFAVIISGIAGAAYLICPHILAKVYIDISNPANTQTLHLITVLFAIIAVSSFFDAIRNVFTGSLRGLLDVKFPMYIGLFVIWVVGLPLGYVLGFLFQMGIEGIATGSLIGMVIGATILALRWKSISRVYS